MNHKDFGELVKALREEHLSGRQKPWTREELSEKTGLPMLLLGSVERGEKANLEPDILYKLADAFGLTSRERREFFNAAVDVSDQISPKIAKKPEQIFGEIQDMIKAIEFPAFIIDSYGDIIAANAQSVVLLSISPDLIKNAYTFAGGFSIMRVVFSEEVNFKGLIGDDAWDMVAASNVNLFRVMTLRNRSSKYFKEVIRYLLEDEHTASFLKYWLRGSSLKADNYTDTDYYQFTHPVWGNFSFYAMTTVYFTNVGELFTVIYIPASSETRKNFTKIAKHSGNEIILLAPWPIKPVSK